MGLLNVLFGNVSKTAKKLALSDKKRMALWEKHIADFSEREALSRQFNFKNVDDAVKNFSTTTELLTKIESMISPELIKIDDEEKLDKEILSEFDKLKYHTVIRDLAENIKTEKIEQSKILSMFKELHNVLITELHLIKAIKKKPKNVRELLLKLFHIIYFNEDALYEIFRKDFYGDKTLHPKIIKIAKSIILEKELKEELETDEERFVKDIIKQMGAIESKNQFRKLAEQIYDELVDAAGEPAENEDITDSIRRMEKIMKNDKTLYKIIKKLRPKYNDSKINAVMQAYRKAYDLGHFIDLEGHFAT